MSGVDVLAVLRNTVCELDCHEKGVRPRTNNEGLLGHGWATAEEVTCSIAAVAELIEASQDAVNSTVNASSYPDGPCIDRTVRRRLIAALARVGRAT